MSSANYFVVLEQASISTSENTTYRSYNRETKESITQINAEAYSLFSIKEVVFYPLWTISNLIPLDCMTRLKALCPRLMLSLKFSLNSGLLVFFTVPVLSL